MAMRNVHCRAAGTLNVIMRRPSSSHAGGWGGKVRSVGNTLRKGRATDKVAQLVAVDRGASEHATLRKRPEQTSGSSPTRVQSCAKLPPEWASASPRPELCHHRLVSTAASGSGAPSSRRTLRTTCGLRSARRCSKGAPGMCSRSLTTTGKPLSFCAALTPPKAEDATQGRVGGTRSASPPQKKSRV